MGSIAFAWGIASAVSLPLGAFLGMWLKPKLKVNSAFMAFGAGALLFALTIELFGHVPHHVKEHGFMALVVSVVGAISGGILFDTLNNILNNRGAFLRKISNAKNYVAKLKMRRRINLVQELSQVKVLNRLEPLQMAKLIDRVASQSFKEGEVIFRQGDDAYDMFFIVSGEVNIIYRDESGHEQQLATLQQNDTFGELGVLSHFPRSADATAKTPVRVYKIYQDVVDEILRESPSLQEDLKQLAESRIDDHSVKTQKALETNWKKETLEHIDKLRSSVSSAEILEESKAVSTHSNAAFAIWLGILIDGIPESLVIGMLAVSAKGMSLAFIAGVFLANMPEAMSSAVSMRSHGMGLKKIYLMWGSICLLTGVGAFIGATMFPANPTGNIFYFVLGIEGLAAGAMLTMIAETMLPEAFEQGGTVVGLSTLGGFLAALTVKVM